ncbi:MAG: glycosyl transferase family 1, partial [Muribaculaceae bacterium]|nr:glycosyl transferase family 1 [Muribaculaceae bacterium]
LDCMLTMDSGNMHLAAIAGTPTLSIWGATHPYCGFAAWRQSDADTIQLPVPCRPCSVFGNRPCRRRDLMCLDAIRPAAD